MTTITTIMIITVYSSAQPGSSIVELAAVRPVVRSASIPLRLYPLPPSIFRPLCFPLLQSYTPYTPPHYLSAPLPPCLPPPTSHSPRACHLRPGWAPLFELIKW